MAEAPSTTAIPVKPTDFQHRMFTLSERLAGAGAIKIVAIGSSTTAGEGVWPDRSDWMPVMSATGITVPACTT
ncbi:hypothetical protein [Bradyrhizobium sp. USDA 3315]